MRSLNDVLDGLPVERRQSIERRVNELISEEIASFARPLAEAVLLKNAVNESANECGPNCDDYAHGDDCPACNPAKWLISQQAEIERLRLRQTCEGDRPYICHELATARAQLVELRQAIEDRDRALGFEELSPTAQDAFRAAVREIDGINLQRLRYVEALLAEAQSLIVDATAELLWWIDEHPCCKGREGDLLARLVAFLTTDSAFLSGER